MMDRLRISGWRSLAAALYALAMALLGFAHLPAGPVGNPSGLIASAQLAALALPDGVLPVICGQSGPDQPAQQHRRGPCDACQLTSAPGALPAPPAVLDSPRLAMIVPPVLAIVSVATGMSLEPQARGPPRLS
jgi:hypothetical protein